MTIPLHACPPFALLTAIISQFHSFSASTFHKEKRSFERKRETWVRELLQGEGMCPGPRQVLLLLQLPVLLQKYASVSDWVYL
jgi:hypothetical protein